MTSLRHILPTHTLQEIPVGGVIRLNILHEQEKTLRAASSRLKRQGVGMWSIRKRDGLIFVQRYI